MSWFGSPDELDRLAGRLSGAACRVRSRARTVRSGAGDLRWRGPAADAFHASVAQEARLLDRAADELDDAAAALHRHADAVRAELARLRALEQAAERALQTGWSALVDVVT
jgi:uncharacterized protein YukE